ncbi:MAG TPA: hypothetical protein VKB46_21525, partial [Pyrinomonadaceae bacterium]|nr:hypothetical protein [Pyrinomonadaceae bacterium]
MDNSLEQIKQLAGQYFSDLTKVETKVLESAVTGRLADCRDVDGAEVDPEKAMDWNGERIVRASLIRWLCTNKDTRSAIHSAGINIAHAKFDGEIDLVGISIGFSLSLFECAIPDGLRLQDAALRNLNLAGSLCGYLIGER